MKATKALGLVFFFVVAAAVGVVIYILGNINQIVKEVVEKVGPEVTQTSVNLRDVDIKLTKGSGELKHFVVGNPVGYDSPYLLKWDTIGVAIDPKSVRSDVVVINDVTVKGVNIKVEQKGLSTNVQALLANLPQGEATGNQGQSGSSGDAAEDVLLALKHLTFADNSIELITDKWGSYRLDMPSFELANLGDSQNGLTPKQLGEAILRPLLKQAQRSAEDRLKTISKEKLEAKLKEKKAELEAKVEEKKDELKQKAKAKEDALKEEYSDEKAELDDKKDELKEKLKKEEDKLKSLFGR